MIEYDFIVNQLIFKLNLKLGQNPDNQLYFRLNVPFNVEFLTNRNSHKYKYIVSTYVLVIQLCLD